MTETLLDPFLWLLLFALAGWGLTTFYFYRRVPQAIMASVVRFFPANVLIVDTSGKILASSQPARQFFGYTEEEMRGLDVEVLMPGELARQHRKQRREFMHGTPGNVMDNEVLCLSKSGEMIPAITRVRTLRLGKATYDLVATTDLRSFKDREESLKALAEQDPLTGIANRRLFDRDYCREWGRALRHKTPLAIIMVDVDAFKKYNDYHGHLAGDACLKTIAAILADILQRSTDVLARYGGEEFVYLLPDLNESQAARKAQEVCERVESANIPHGRSETSRWVTVSVGVAATVPSREDDMRELIQRADAALYAAKSCGRNNLQTHSALSAVAQAFDTVTKTGPDLFP